MEKNYIYNKEGQLVDTCLAGQTYNSITGITPKELEEYYIKEWEDINNLTT